eukprot:16451645-Heterocapsa_arctica.AAC.1
MAAAAHWISNLCPVALACVVHHAYLSGLFLSASSCDGAPGSLFSAGAAGCGRAPASPSVAIPELLPACCRIAGSSEKA